MFEKNYHNPLTYDKKIISLTRPTSSNTGQNIRVFSLTNKTNPKNRSRP